MSLALAPHLGLGPMRSRRAPGPTGQQLPSLCPSGPCQWARAWWHTRGGAGGLGWRCIYKRRLASEFHSILTPGLLLEPCSAPLPPSAPPDPFPWGPVSLSLCNPCPDCYLRGQYFLPLFAVPVGPLAHSQKHSRALSNPPACVGGAGEGGRRQEAPAAPTYCSPGPPTHLLPHPHPMPNWPTLAHTMRHLPNLAFAAISFFPRPKSPPWGCPPKSWVWGSGLGFSIAGLFQDDFFPS